MGTKCGYCRQPMDEDYLILEFGVYTHICSRCYERWLRDTVGRETAARVMQQTEG